MKEKVEALLKANKKVEGRSRAELAEKLGITYNGLQHKMSHNTFKYSDIELMEDFFGVEKGYFSIVQTTVENNNENWKDKYFNSLEVINRLMFIVNQNGIKIDGLGKFDVSGLHGVKFFYSY